MDKKKYITHGLGSPENLEQWLNERHAEGYELVALAKFAGRPKYTPVMRLRDEPQERP